MGRLDGNGVEVEIADPRGRIAQLELEVQRLERANDQFQYEREKWLVHVKAVETRADEFRRENEQLKRQLAQADRNCEELQEEREAAKRLRDQANAEIVRLKAERDKLWHERQGWIHRCKANDATYDALEREHIELKAEMKRLKADPTGDFNRGVEAENDALLATIKCLVKLI